MAADSPLYGLEVSFPEGALTGAEETISVEYRADLPGVMQDGLRELGAQQIGPTVVLGRSGNGDFGEAVLLRLPARSDALRTMDVMPVAWDTELGRYVPLETVAVDPAAGHVYALTRHFSTFTVFGYPVAPPRPVQTGFAPAANGFSHPNISTMFDNGDCYGISAFARWYWQHRRGLGLYDAFGGGDRSFFGDSLVRELMAESQMATLTPNRRVREALFKDASLEAAVAGLTQLGASTSTPPPVSKKELEIFHGRRLAAQLLSDGPQLLAIGARGWGAHAVLVYAFDTDGGGEGTFRAYDPNFPYPHPDGPLSIHWSSVSGFQPLTYPGGNGSKLDRFWVTAADSWFSPGVLASIEQRALAGSLERFGVFTFDNLLTTEGTRACISTDDLPNTCHIVTSAIGNGTPGSNVNGTAVHMNVWNRTTGAGLVNDYSLVANGSLVQHVAVEVNRLQAGDNIVEVIVSDAPPLAATIENSGWITRYRAFGRSIIRPMRLSLQGKPAIDGYEIQALLDGRDVLPDSGSYEWRIDGRLLDERGNRLKLSTTVTAPEGEVWFTVLEGPGSDNPQARHNPGAAYDATYTVRSIVLGTPISDDCMNGQCASHLFCNFEDAVVGKISQAVDYWTLRLDGTAMLNTLADGTPITVTGQYVPGSGAINLIEDIAPEAINPPGSQFTFYSEGRIATSAALDPSDGSIRGTSVDTLTTRWSRDSRSVTCVQTVDYVAFPRLPNSTLSSQLKTRILKAARD